jgi:hypothetical protein
MSAMIAGWTSIPAVSVAAAVPTAENNMANAVASVINHFRFLFMLKTPFLFLCSRLPPLQSHSGYPHKKTFSLYYFSRQEINAFQSSYAIFWKSVPVTAVS